MILEDITKKKSMEYINIQCDLCNKKLKRKLNDIKTSRKRRKQDKDYCQSCSAINSLKKKQQCKKEYWTKEKRIELGYKIKTSKKYIEGMKNRSDISGKNNPMYNKKHTKETIKKMSISRTGKTGENATAWKGGKLSINNRTKSALQRKYNWFHRVMERDNLTCQDCGSTKKLDAHHIIPLSKIIKKLLNNNINLLTESEKSNWLIIQPEIVDNKLKNGITLCRKCHKKIHKNWGSHEPKTHEFINENEKI